MSKQTELKIFDDKQIRTFWDSEQEKWSVSFIDVIEILTVTDRPRKYWNDLKAKLKKEGNERGRLKRYPIFYILRYKFWY